MKKYWFKNKSYGWGWTPATWEGWAVLAIYAIALIGNIIYNRQGLENKEILQRVVTQSIAVTVILLYVCYLTGERPGWRWGKKK